MQANQRVGELVTHDVGASQSASAPELVERGVRKHGDRHARIGFAPAAGLAGEGQLNRNGMQLVRAKATGLEVFEGRPMRTPAKRCAGEMLCGRRGSLGTDWILPDPGRG